MSEFNVGDKVRYKDHKAVYTVEVSAPDGCGRIVVRTGSGDYHVAYENNLVLVPNRYVVEYRLPKVGERFFSYEENKVIAAPQDFVYSKRAVIVEEL